HVYYELFGHNRMCLRYTHHESGSAVSNLDSLPSFADVVAGRLFDVNVLACLTGPHGHEGMPMIRCGDRDHIDVTILQRGANVLHRAGRVAAACLDFFTAASIGARIAINVVGLLHTMHAGNGVDVSILEAVMARRA